MNLLMVIFQMKASNIIITINWGLITAINPKILSLWDLDRFVEEVEQVRIALGLTNDNFYLYGQSWGGILGMQYALKYQEHLKGLIISNMVPSIPDYQNYSDEVLAPKLDPEVLKEIMFYEDKEDYTNARYMELVVNNYIPNTSFVCP